MKNKTLMKTLSAFLAVVMVICSAPLSGFVGLDLPDWLDFSKIFGVEAEALTSGIYTYEISNGEVTITDCDTSASGAISIPSTIGGYPVTSIGSYAFAYCDSLTSVTIPDSVTSIGDSAFLCCYGLTSVTIPDSVTSIGDYAFYYCSNLISVTIPDSVTSIGDSAFYNCDSLTSVTIPDSVKSIGNYAFGDCDSLTSIKVDSNNKNYCSDSYGVLYNKNKTTLIQYPIGNSRETFTIPDSVTSIGDAAFYNCDGLISVTIGDSVKSIGDYAFLGCNSLTSVTIPDSVTSIGYEAFSDCDSFTDVYYTGTEAEWNNISIGDYNDALANATIHYNYVPSDTSDAKIRFGADRFTFGEDISGYAGESVTGLIVYTSADYGTSSLTVTSSDPNVVSVGIISHDSGDYICIEENEHRATVQLNLKAKGTATITITSPEGVSENVDVNVESHNDSNFICHTNSTSDSLMVGTNIKLMVGYEENGNLDSQVKAFSVVVSDDDILSVNIGDWNSEYGREYSIVANKVGTATVSFTNPNNNESFYLEYQVVPQESCFTFDNLPEKEYEKGKVTHFYNYGGLVINDFEYSAHKNKDGVVDYYHVTINVYNNKNMYGAVTVYDANGKVDGYYVIDRHEEMPGSFTETVEDLYHNTKTLLLLFNNRKYYSGEDISTLTEVEIDVPAGGYISISNNATTSEVVAVANYTAVIIDLICNMKDYVTISREISGAENKIIDAVTGKLIEDELIESVEKSFKEEIGNVNWSYKTYDSYVNAVTLRCQEMGINLIEIIKDEIATVTGIGEISESVITNILPTGWIINLLYAGNGTADYLLFITEVSLSQRNPQGVYIYSPKTSNEYVSNNIIVQPQSNIVDAEKVVHTYKVYNTSEMDMNLSVWGEESEKHSKYTVHNITMYKNGEETQPDSEVVVKIPIPEGYNQDNICVYHVDENGVLTNMYATVIDGYAVFTTNHFSYYMIVDHTIEHTWGDWEVITQPTTTTDGVKERRCSVCGETETSVVPKITINIVLADSNDNVVSEQTIEGDLTEYTFEGIADGEYTVTVSKANYVTRKYDVVASDGEVTVEFKLNLLGDIDGNGKVNITDYNAILRHVKKTSALDGYAFDCADIDGNGKILVTDYNAVLRHVKKTELLW